MDDSTKIETPNELVNTYKYEYWTFSQFIKDTSE